MDKRKHRHSSSARTTDKQDTESVAYAIKCCICGLMLSLAAALVALAVISAYSLTKPDPESFALPVASFLSFPCAILGGFVSCKLFRGSTAICTVIFGLMNITLSLIVFPILPDTDGNSISALSFFIMRGILLLCCTAGCLLGAKSNSSPKKHKRKKR